MAWCCMSMQLLVIAALLVPVASRRSGQQSLVETDPSLATADSLAPPALLLISSPAEKKVSYVQFSGFSVASSPVRPLIDAGLGGPRGLAYDPTSTRLYVADPPKRRILSFRLRLRGCTDEGCASNLDLEVDGVAITVAQNVLTSWIAVDSDGSLYYTDQEVRSVNKIDTLVLQRLASSTLLAGDLKFVSQQELDALEALASAPSPGNAAIAEARESDLEKAGSTAILRMHQAELSENIGVPSGIFAEGAFVYWANSAGGLAKGSLVVGAAIVGGAGEADGAMAMDNCTDAAYGVAMTFDKVLFAGEHEVLGLGKAGGPHVTVAAGLEMPRGLTWDGDSTVYVADQGSNAVFSLASGRLDQPLHRVVEFHAPFGLAFIGASHLHALSGGAWARSLLALPLSSAFALALLQL